LRPIGTVIASSQVRSSKYKLIVAQPPPGPLVHKGEGGLQKLVVEFFKSKERSSMIVPSPLSNSVRKALKTTGYNKFVSVVVRSGNVYLVRK